MQGSAGVPELDGFQPFVLEAGGWIHPKSWQWLLSTVRQFISDDESRCHEKAKAIYVAVARTLTRPNAKLLTHFDNLMPPN